MVEIGLEDDGASCFVYDQRLRIVKDDFAAGFDKPSATKEAVWHMVEDRNTCGCCGDVIKRDCAFLYLVHTFPICYPDLYAVGDGASVADACLSPCIVVACPGI